MQYHVKVVVIFTEGYTALSICAYYGWKDVVKHLVDTVGFSSKGQYNYENNIVLQGDKVCSNYFSICYLPECFCRDLPTVYTNVNVRK